MAFKYNLFILLNKCSFGSVWSVWKKKEQKRVKIFKLISAKLEAKISLF